MERRQDSRPGQPSEGPVCRGSGPSPQPALHIIGRHRTLVRGHPRKGGQGHRRPPYDGIGSVGLRPGPSAAGLPIRLSFACLPPRSRGGFFMSCTLTLWHFDTFSCCMRWPWPRLSLFFRREFLFQSGPWDFQYRSAK